MNPYKLSVIMCIYNTPEEYLEKAIKLIDIAWRIDQKLNGNEAQKIIKVINNYSNALNLLDDYDHGKVVKLKMTKSKGGEKIWKMKLYYLKTKM